jgi:hypothetical protein
MLTILRELEDLRSIRLVVAEHFFPETYALDFTSIAQVQQYGFILMPTVNYPMAILLSEGETWESLGELSQSDDPIGAHRAPHVIFEDVAPRLWEQQVPEWQQ